MELFDKPRFFHIGYDEETASMQANYDYVVIRQHDLYWHDFYFFIKEVEKHSARPWIWTDYEWHHPEDFYAHMPKSVIQSSVYYETFFEKEERADYARSLECIPNLEQKGYDQIPGGSNHISAENFGLLVNYCKKRISPEHLLGFIQTVWRPLIEPYRQRHIEAIEAAGKVIKNFTQNQ